MRQFLSIGLAIATLLAAMPAKAVDDVEIFFERVNESGKTFATTTDAYYDMTVKLAEMNKPSKVLLYQSGVKFCQAWRKTGDRDKAINELINSNNLQKLAGTERSVKAYMGAVVSHAATLHICADLPIK